LAFGPRFLDSLSDEKLAELKKRARRLKAVAGRNLRLGVKDGSCRIGDPLLTAELSAGLYLWLPKWRSADAVPVAMADAITDFALFGLRQRSGMQARRRQNRSSSQLP
jgi:hypothetical protein